MISVIKPQKNEELEYNCYEYEYQARDKIFYYEVPSEITKMVLDYSNNFVKDENNNLYTRKRLAGDIKKEFSLPYDEEIYDTIHKMLKKNLSKLYRKPVINFIMDGPPWVNYQQPTEYNPIHHHSGELSLVWYLDMPEKIMEEHLQQISRSQTRGLIQFHSSYSPFDTMLFSPKTNDMFLFSSNHRHQVYPFYSDGERISLSLNISQIFFAVDF